MGQLDQLIGRYQEQGQPLELLTLSACETAAGDERAALGLAGIAVQAGARSVLATLWAIADQSTPILIQTFYRQLFDHNLAKAKALQKAQLTLVNHESFSHPRFWAPFLLIGNWL